LSEPAPKLTLVQQALEEVGGPTDAARLKATKDLLARYAPSIAKRGRQDREAEILAEAGVKAVSDLTLLPALKAAHEADLMRNAKAIGRAAHRDGVLQGVVAGMALAVGLAFVTWYVLRDVVIFNTAQARVELAAPPSLADQYDPETYAPGRREPASAP
jgi:hypothetical protein